MPVDAHGTAVIPYLSHDIILLDDFFNDEHKVADWVAKEESGHDPNCSPGSLHIVDESWVEGIEKSVEDISSSSSSTIRSLSNSDFRPSIDSDTFD